MQVMATIEARMGSSRLPGKVMLELAGKPMLQWKIMQVRQAKTVDCVKVASASSPANALIENFCERISCPVFRGSEDDVLDRLLKATEVENPEVIVQLTGDNPLISPKLIDDAVKYLLENDLDFVSNSLSQNTIIGMNVRCFKRSALVAASEKCTDPKIRVHGGYCIQQYPDSFRIGENAVPKQCLRDDIRLTVDEVEDFELVRRIISIARSENQELSLDNILSYFDRIPDLKSVNSAVRQKLVGEG
ncbi:cytidylyltransferase domain-containing protein [Thalassospira sp. MIT1370]|jgi:spore coat polysaccharide biosynthesis protein SpsF|uniref:cytidylyltransferase domain-containing protein n=1 Tax=unclassified Thalassospira TaxID=2648997 RepID=UPI00399AF004